MNMRKEEDEKEEETEERNDVQGFSWIETLHALILPSQRNRIGFPNASQAPSWREFIDLRM